MFVYCLNASVSSWDKELGVYELLHRKDDTILDAQPDRSAELTEQTISNN